MNVSKTKVVVYQSARATKAPCVVTYKGAPVEVLPFYKYLGLDLHSSARIDKAGTMRAESGQRAVYILLQRCKDADIRSPVMQISMFRSMVVPIMLYGLEAWAPSALCHASAVNNPMERVFRRFLRRVLGLLAGTPTPVLLAEAGQYPLSVDVLVSLARAWNCYVSMPEEWLARQVFDRNPTLTLMGANIAPNKLRAPWSTQMVHCLFDAHRWLLTALLS